jgi:aldehyde:ferredoxin oxidoreductase
VKSDVPEGPFSVRDTEGPEYETIFAFGSDCGVKDLDALIKANHLCDELGLDTISMGGTIACAHGTCGKRKNPQESSTALTCASGDPGSMIEAIWRTAYRAGIGADLALVLKML